MKINKDGHRTLLRFYCSSHKIISFLFTSAIQVHKLLVLLEHVMQGTCNTGRNQRVRETRSYLPPGWVHQDTLDQYDQERRRR